MIEWYFPWSGIDSVLKLELLIWLAAVACSYWIAWRTLVLKRPWLKWRKRE